MNSRIVTPRERVMAALHGENTGKVPFTVYECMLPQCFTERVLRNRGLCVVYRMASYKTVYPDVGKKSYSYVNEEGQQVIETVYSTPSGDLSSIVKPSGFTEWALTHFFKDKEDYKKLLYLIKNRRFVPNYDAVIKKASMLGDDFILRDQLLSEPLQELMHYMGPETFCYEWLDNRDEVLKLYDALLELSREVFSIVADGPLEFANLGGNVVPQLIGVDTFRKYYTPVYNEAAEVLHQKDKLVGCHFDADNTLIMKDIANTALDYIEAYDAGMGPSIKAAKSLWPEKVLWLNWPSSWHLLPADEVYGKTLQILDEASPCNNFLVGITEDVPEERWQSNFNTIMDAIDIHC